MRAPLISMTLLAVSVLAGCSTHRRAPYANDPVLLHYKPTLNDSATIIAEKQWRHAPAKPPKPPTSTDKPAEEPASTPSTPTAGLVAPKPEAAGQLLAPPPKGTPAVVAQTSEQPGSQLPMRPVEAGAVASTPVPPPPVSAGAANPPASGVNLPAPDGIQPAKAEQAAEASAAPAPPPEISSPSAHHVAPGMYGHDKDYHWVQGVLERHYRGYYCIRYCDPSEEDANGGKVRLIESASLEQFQEGDVIGIQGEIVPNSTDSFHTNPRYLIHDIWLVRKK